MADSSTLPTVERIDRALARIEAAAKGLVANRADLDQRNTDLGRQNADLDQRNKTLRDSVADAIATLDAVIGENVIGESKAD